MRYPYDLFISFLITRKADVNGTLTSLGLPELTENELLSKNLFSGNLPPAVRSYFKSKSDKITSKKAFIDWTESHDIREMWELQPEFIKTSHRTLTSDSTSLKEAFDIFSDPRHRTAMSLLLMRNFDIDDIASTFLTKFSKEVGHDVITLGQRYFFRFSNMRPVDWRNLLNGVSPEERNKLLIGRDGSSKEFIEQTIGVTPKISYEAILSDIMVSSYYKFKALVDVPLMDSMSQRWATMAMVAGEKKVRFTNDNDADLDEELQLRFDFEETQFPTLEELSDREN